MVMTKKELIAALAEFPDNAKIMVAYTYEGNTVLEGIVAADENDVEGRRRNVQLTAVSLDKFIKQGWQDNLEQNAKVTARAEGLVGEKEWRDAQHRAKGRRAR
jgi:hypothetical protein